MAEAGAWHFAVDPFADIARGMAHMAPLRAATKSRQKPALRYRSIDGTLTDRTVRPLQMEYRGRVWTLTAWCELRQAFSVFRIGLIEALAPLPALFTMFPAFFEGREPACSSSPALPALFTDDPGKTLADDLATQPRTMVRTMPAGWQEAPFRSCHSGLPPRRSRRTEIMQQSAKQGMEPRYSGTGFIRPLLLPKYSGAMGQHPQG